MFATTATASASARAENGDMAALIAYPSSRRASSSALIAEI